MMDMTRDAFIRVALGTAVTGAAALTGLRPGFAAPETNGSAALALSHSFTVDPQWEADNQETIGELVRAAHGDLDFVRARLAAEPWLANARFYQFDEAPIEAASHMGRPDIAQYLLGCGAPLTVHCAAMLGQRETLAAYLQRDAALATRPGAHGIPMMFHAAFSGDTQLTQLLVDHDGGRDYTPALHAAAWKDRPAMATWLIDHGAELNKPDFQGRTPLALAVELGNTEVEAVLRAAGARLEADS
jgi:uncharacterized protein